MPPLSSLLLQREVATLREVDSALARQAVRGGDLVTSLLEMASVDEAKVLQVLGEYEGLTPMAPGPLALPDAELLRRVPRELALHHTFVPQRIVGDTLQIVVSTALTPSAEQQLSAQLALRLEPRISTLARVRQALSAAFDIPFDRRFARIIARLDGLPEPDPSDTEPPRTTHESLLMPRLARVSSVDGQGGPLTHPSYRSFDSAAVLVQPIVAVSDHPSRPPAAPHSAPSAPAPVNGERLSLPPEPALPWPVGARLRDMPVFSEPNSAKSVPTIAERRRGPFTLAMAHEALKQADTPGAVLRVLFDFSRQFFEYAALFVVRADLAEGVDSAGPGTGRSRLRGIGVPLDMPSILATARERKTHLLVRPADDGIDGCLREDLQRPMQSLVLVVPLSVRGRVVAVVYGDEGSLPVDLALVGEVLALNALVSTVLEQMVLRRKWKAHLSKPPSAAVVRSAEDYRKSTLLGMSPRQASPASEGPSSRPSEEPSKATQRVEQESTIAGAAAEPWWLAPHRSATAPYLQAMQLSPLDGGAAAQPKSVPPAAASRTPSAPPYWGPRKATDPFVPLSSSVSQGAASRRGDAMLPEQNSNGMGRLSSSGAAARSAPVRPSTPVLVAKVVQVGAPVLPAPAASGTGTDSVDEAWAQTVPGSGRTQETGPASSPQLEVTESEINWDEVPELTDGEPVVLAQSPVVVIDETPVVPPPAELIRASAGEMPETPAAPEVTAAFDEAPELTISEAEASDAMVLAALEELEQSPPPAPACELRGADARESSVAEGAVVCGPRLPPRPISPSDVGLPSVIVDLSGEADELLNSLESQSLTQVEIARVRRELVRLGSTAAEQVAKRFPGLLYSDVDPGRDLLPPASKCGPVLAVAVAMAGAVAPQLEELCRSSTDPKKRLWAMLALAEMDGSQASLAVSRGLFDEEQQVRKAARACVRSGLVERRLWVRSIRELVHQVAMDTEESERRRVLAIETITLLREVAAVPALVKALEATQASVRAAAHQALRVLSRREFPAEPNSWRQWWQTNQRRDRTEWLIDALRLGNEAASEEAIEELRQLVGDDLGYRKNQSRDERGRVLERFNRWWQETGRAKTTIPPVRVR